MSPQDKTNQFWESLSTRVSSVALMFPILRFAVKMSVNLAASQTPRLSMSASDNLRAECAYLIDLKWRIQVTLLCKRQLKASLGWFCLPTWGHAPDWVRPIWARQASTSKRSQHENLQVSHGALARAGSEGYRGEKPFSLLPPAPLASLHRGSHLSEYPGCQHKRTVCLLAKAHRACLLRNAALPLIMFGSFLLFPYLWALGSTSLPAQT